MSRLHLFEIEDQSWCPGIIRESVTDFLLGLYRVLRLFEPAYQKIEELLIKTQANAIIDCCSGSGGPMVQLREFLDSKQMAHITITLTDKYPNLEQFKNLEEQYQHRLSGYKHSVDARLIPSHLNGIRCFFSSFHHFAPEQAVKILQDAANNRAPIAIFESTQRYFTDFLRAFVSPLLMLVILPFAKRLTWQKFLITYVLPIAPLVFMWDYLVSNARTYSSKEFQQLIQQITAPDYTWEYGKLWSPKAKSHIPYLIGYPNAKSSDQTIQR
jgi:hypothetical protein